MTNRKNIKIIVIIVLFFAIVTGVYVIITNMNRDKLQYDSFLKNYEVNEYIPTYVSDESMARIYFTDYFNKIFTTPEQAFNLLDSEYRNLKFGSYANFLNYVESIKSNSYVMSKYYKKDSKGFIIFGVYDTNDNLIIFKTKGVMQYSVFLDDYTVEVE